MGNLDDTLKKHAKRLGIERQVEAVGVVEKAQKEIAKYIPEEDFEVISYNRDVLKVRVASSVVASELQINLDSVKTGLGVNNIKTIN